MKKPPYRRYPEKVDPAWLLLLLAIALIIAIMAR